jgi:hypothetical protein
MSGHGILDDLAKRGAKILLDTKTPKNVQPSKKSLLGAPMMDTRDAHQKFIDKVIKEKPKRAVLLEFFEDQITLEEAKL